MTIRIISTGGTINKRYNELTGQLDVEDGSPVVLMVASLCRGNTDIIFESLYAKDSLDITDSDRKRLVTAVEACTDENIIILHGTDTMDKSAHVLAKAGISKNIIFVGSMQPYSICPDEAIFNIASAVGFLRCKPEHGVYIAMHSLVVLFNEIYKNRTEGVFRLLNNS